MDVQRRLPHGLRAWCARLLVAAVVALVGLAPAATASADGWVQNFAPTELWSGPDASATSFGTAPQWDYFQVVAPMGNGRIYVRVVRTNGFAFVDAAVVGPSGQPPLGWPNVPAADPALAAPSVPPVAAPPSQTTASVAGAPAPSSPAAGGIASQATLGPVPGYAIRADAGFTTALQALDRLRHTWTLEALASTGTRLAWGDLPAEAAALYEPREAVITLNRRWSRSDPRALAALIEHEAKHVADVLAGIDVYSSSGCLTTEVNAFLEEAKTWGELVGPKGKPDPRDDLERSLNYKLSLLDRGPDAIRSLIVQNPGYRAECQLR